MGLQLYLGKVAIDGAMTAGSQTLTTSIAGAAVGMYCDVLGAGPSGATLVACITGVGSGTLTLGYAASVTVTAATVTIWNLCAPGRYSLSGEVSSLTNLPSLSFQLHRINNTAVPVVGQPVLLIDGSLVPTPPSASMAGDIFGGSIASVDATQIAGNTSATYDCQCVSWESIAARRGTAQPNDSSGDPLNGKFSGMAAGGVFSYLATHQLGSDISAVSVVTGPTITEITFDYTDCASAFDSICQAASDGTDTYIWRMDARRNLYFELQTTNAAPWNISNSDALTGYTFSQTLEKFANVATVTPQNSTGDTIDSTLVATYNNNASIDARSGVEGGTGYHEVIVAQGDANRSMDAATLAQSIAETYGVVPDTVQYVTYRGGLRAGQLQTIVLSDLGVSGSFLIDSVTLDMSNGRPNWTIHAVDGALIGDWKTALAHMSGGSSVSGGTISGGGGGGGGCVGLWADSTLGIQADAAPAAYLNTAVSPTAVKAYVKGAPVGAAVALTLYVGSTAWLSLSIAAGATSAVATNAALATAGSVAANANIRLAITAVGTTFPGSDLSVFIYY